MAESCFTGPMDYLVCDQTQLYEPQQVDQLARIVDEHEVLCRRHHRRAVTRVVAQAPPSDPLPIERPDELEHPGEVRP